MFAVLFAVLVGYQGGEYYRGEIEWSGDEKGRRLMREGYAGPAGMRSIDARNASRSGNEMQ
jgi:hypothetical protein